MQKSNALDSIIGSLPQERSREFSPRFEEKIFSLLPAIFGLIFSLKVYIQRKPCEIEQNHISHGKEPQNKSKFNE